MTHADGFVNLQFKRTRQILLVMRIYPLVQLDYQAPIGTINVSTCTRTRLSRVFIDSEFIQTSVKFNPNLLCFSITGVALASFKSFV